MIRDLLHEEHRADGQLVLFRCRECGHTDLSLGSLHAHCERHRGYTRLGIQLPAGKTSPGNADELMAMTEAVVVEEASEIAVEEVDTL